jgi:hypothetical protein
MPAKETFQSMIFAEEAMLLNTSTRVKTTVMMSKYLMGRDSVSDIFLVTAKV